MDPLKVLDIPEEYDRPPYLPDGSNVSFRPRYSTECVGNSAHIKNLIRKIKRRLAKGQIKLPDFFVGVGNSGMGIASILSYEFNIPMIHIRKGCIGRYDTEPCESHLIRKGYPNKDIDSAFYKRNDLAAINAKRKEMEILGFPDWSEGLWGKTFWFVDDCLDSGTTFRHAIHLCTRECGMICVGVALTWFTYHKQRRLREWALLKHKDAPMTLISRQRQGEYY